MAGSRTLKLSILADVDDLRRKLDQGNNEVQGFGAKLDGWSKKAGAAFLAAGAAAAAYAGKLAIDGVKAAIEDEAAQVRLQNALKNTVGATQGAVNEAEKWILKQSLATGIADDQYRPALERLTRSTKDIGEAQKLTSLAADIAKAKNLDLVTVANALAKANDGNVNALKKLGITLGDNATNLADYNKAQKDLEKAHLDANLALEAFGEGSKEYIKASEKVKEKTEAANNIAKAGIDVFGELGKEFRGAAAESANTFQGKMDRLKVAMDEAKETIGVFILNAITPLVNTIIQRVVPAISDFATNIKSNLQPVINVFKPILEGLTAAFNTVKDSLDRNYEKLKPFYDLIKVIANFIADTLAPIVGQVLGNAFRTLGSIISGVISIFSTVVNTLNSIYERIRSIIDFIKNNPITNFFSGASYATPSPAPTGNTPYLPSTPIYGLNNMGSSGNTVINVTGALDPESVARQINDILTQSAGRGGGAINLGVSV